MTKTIKLLQDIQKTIDAIDRSTDAYIASFGEKNPQKASLLRQIHKKRSAKVTEIARNNAEKYK